MKEASGEANMTVITIILIGIVLAVGTPIITNMMKSNQERSKCANIGKCYNGSQCCTCDEKGGASGNNCTDVPADPKP